MISIITVGMNHKEYLKAFYESLYGKDMPHTLFETIYVDNCSVDGSVEWLQKKYPQVKIIVNKEPYGFGRNNNIGVKASNGDYIAIVNPDIEVQKGCIDLINDYARANNNEGVICPQLLNPDGSLQFSVRKFITLSMILRRWLSGENDNSNNSKVRKYLCKDLDFSETQEIDWAIGAALFMSKETYEVLGGFDERYFLYVEDEDLCLRAWEKGIPVIYYPEAKLIHNHLRGSTHLSKKTLYHFKSLFTFFKLHGINYKRKS